MILVDSSVWIDYFQGMRSPETDKLDALLSTEALLAGDLIVAEVLQGFSRASEFNRDFIPFVDYLGLQSAMLE
ncbi:MAG: hypothetical protein ACRYGL_17940 [Janthinobacterium lividum]